MTEDPTPRDKTPEASGGSPADEGADGDAGSSADTRDGDAGSSADTRDGDAGSSADTAGDEALQAGAPAEKRADDAEGDAGAAPQAGPPAYRPSYAFLVLVSFVSLAADLGTKWWATVRLTSPDRTEGLFGDASRKIVVIKDHLNFIFAKNPGGAWGILQGESEAVRRPFFLLISVAAVIFIVSLYRKLEPGQWALRWGLPLVLGGALGNLVDRIRYGYVVDFIQIFITPKLPSTFPWPTFNIADVAIVAGVLLMAIDMFASRRPAKGAGAQAGEAGPGSSARGTEGSGKAPASGG